MLLLAQPFPVQAQSPSSGLSAPTKARLQALKAVVQADPRRGMAEAYAIIRRAAALRDVPQRRLTIAASKRLAAEAAIRLDDLQTAGKLIDEALALVEDTEPNSSILAEVLLSKGSIQALKGQLAGALAAYQSAHRVFRLSGDNRGQAVALIYISSLYSDARDNSTALRYLTQAIDVYKDDQSFMRAVHNNRGIILQDMKRYKAAEDDFQEALRLADAVVDQADKAQLWANIARNRVKSSDVRGTERAVATGLQFARSARSVEWERLLLAIAAEAALRKDKAEQAGQLITQAFNGVELESTILSYREAHDTAYRAYRALGRSKEALAHLTALKRLDDEATKLATTTSTALMGARFDFANQELRIAQLRADELRREAAVQRAQAQSERRIFLVSGGATAVVIFLLAFALFTVRRSRNTVSAANDVLEVTNTALGKALAAKTEFLATTSHEIRTPLNGILGMTEVMLTDRALPPRIRDRLSVVHGAGKTMRALVDDILDVAKMETGNLTIESAPFDLGATLREVSILWNDQARAKGLTFTARLDDAPRGMVGDAARVRQIVFNLLSNALKFTADGEIALCAGVSADRQSVSITVRDTGIGIPADQQAAVFESFRQADTSTTRRFGGTGLGLSICRNLAEAMGGTVMIASEPGRGSTFTVTLPLVEVDIGSPCVQPARGATLMIMESNPIAQGMWRALLTPHAGAPVFVRTADEAVDTLRGGGIRQVLIDNVTAEEEIGRVTAAAEVAEAEVTLLWPTARAGERESLLAKGVDRVLVKPIRGLQLVEAMYDEPQGAALVSQAA